MNVIITNKQEDALASLNIEVIKTLRGEFDTEEIIGTFSNFFFARMIIDVTALKDYSSILTYQKLSIGLPVDKVILMLTPEVEQSNAGLFVSKLISMGYYNFTSSSEGVSYLLTNPNTYKDVAHLHQLDSQIVTTTAVVNDSGHSVMNVVTSSSNGNVIGVKNLTENAGATSLVYMMKRQLEEAGRSVLALEVDRRDFIYYNDSTMISTTKDKIASELLKARNYSVVLIDLNGADEAICDSILYLLEPSIIKLNKLMLKDRNVFSKLNGKKIILNKAVLSDGDISTFQKEAGVNFFYVLPPVNDRERPVDVTRLLQTLGLL